MTFFQSISANDLVTFEGYEVSNITPVLDQYTKDIIHYTMAVKNGDGGIDLRKFRPDEIRHLIENEIMIIKRGHFSPVMMRDRQLYAGRELNGANAAQRARIDLIEFQCRLMKHSQAMGMKLTREGVEEYRSAMERDFAAYQARKVYGAQRPSTSHRLHPLPSNSTLLRSYKKYRKAGFNINVFLQHKSEPADTDIQSTADFYFVIERLGKYATMKESTKGEVIADMIEEVKQENALRRQNGLAEIKILSQRQYERWIDLYLDPFEVCAQREGHSVAISKFGSFEPGRRTTALGELVIFDAWRSHLKVLDCTR